MMTEYGFASPVVSAAILVGLRHIYAIYYFKAIRGFDPTQSWLGAVVVTPAARTSTALREVLNVRPAATPASVCGL